MTNAFNQCGIALISVWCKFTRIVKYNYIPKLVIIIAWCWQFAITDIQNLVKHTQPSLIASASIRSGKLSQVV
ncbi:Uncharacterised protein [Vibrio cholerae]|nr:Uncharacterised protein [Vibrio cholerae]CSD42864.1 Uncharacterised protein [Vibrio cholerae]